MDKIIQYKVVVANEYEEFHKLIENEIGQGWQPIGGISIVAGQLNRYGTMNQAMVKYACS